MVKKLYFKSPELKNFRTEEWNFLGLWKQDLFSACFWAGWFDKSLKKELNINIPEPGTAILHGGNFFCKKSALEQLEKDILSKVKSRESYLFENLKNSAERTYTDSITFAKKNENSPVSIEIFSNFLEHGKKLHFFWCISACYLTIILEKLLQEAISEEKISTELVPNLIPKISTPLLEQQSELVILKKRIGARTLEEIRNNKELLELIEDHRERYSWIEIANWIGEELTLERLYAQIINSNESDSQTENKVVNLSEETKFLLSCMSNVGWVRQAAAEYTSMFTKNITPFLTKIAEKLDLTYRELVKLSHAEIADSLQNKNMQSKSNLKLKIQKREQMNWLLLSREEGYALIENAEDINLLKQKMIPDVDKEISEIKGQIGNLGKARGLVKIIMNVDDFKKFQQGEILVTTMTTPDFVILMQKSLAIITDIGGMLCHAAIVSREIGKPCIIGTKIATKVLKDGDLVEVDANSGTVKIIKRNK